MSCESGQAKNARPTRNETRHHPANTHLLDAAGGGSALTSRLGRQLLAWSLSTGGLACRLLGTGHRFVSLFDFAVSWTVRKLLIGFGFVCDATKEGRAETKTKKTRDGCPTACVRAVQKKTLKLCGKLARADFYPRRLWYKSFLYRLYL